MSAVDLKLMIQAAGSAYRVEARCMVPDADAPTEASATVQIDRARLDALTLDPTAYGLALGKMVLAGPIGGILGTARAIAERDEAPLRLRLDLDSDADALHTLRWETLRDPARPDQPLLTTGAQVMFSRYLSSSAWQPVRVPPLEELRALAVLSSPLDLPDFGLSPLDLETERALVAASFSPIPVMVLGRGEANLDTITQHLHEGYDILYLLAHGRADDGDTLIYLEDADGLTAPTLGSEVATQIAELERRPRLVILGSCETAGALLALGPRLAQVGVPAVVGMQDTITVATLRRFLPECLKVLQQDGRIDLAVAQARGLVRERPDFWMPVLFLRLTSGRLWEMAGTTPERPLTPEELLASLPLDDIPEPQTLPMPHRMPLRPNPLFVGRERELREVAQLLRKGERVVILVGIGGVGKTQLAVELAHRYGSSFAGGVFWVSCADPNGIAAEVAACGQLLGLSLTGLDLDVQVRLTRAAWETELPRLLIFDTCEEEQVLRQWLPTSGGARVIVTSRKQRGWSLDLPVALLPVKELARAESVALLQHLAPRLSAKEAYQIAGVLGDLPLALHLSGYYLARYHIAVATYLAKLVNVPLQHISLQGHQVQGMPTNEEPHVERAFALSLSRLEANNLTDDLARQLLIRAACFAPGEPFRREWLEATVTLEGDDEAQMLARTDAVERLLELGFVEPIGLELLRLHRLLAAYTVQTLHDQAAQAAVERVIGDEADKANGTTVPAPMQPVLPHLRHLVQRADGREDEQVARLVQALGVYFDLAGSYEEARALYERALDIRERVLGATHPDTATSLNNLAGILGAQGAYREARELLERALAIREQVLGRDHPDTARSLNGLATLLRAQGACGEARPLVERALAIRERVLGTDHPDTARSLNGLATLLQHQGAYEEARALYERALGSIERELGADHPVTATILNNLASLHQQQGAYEEARALYKRALDIRERVLGADHPDTAQSLNRLATLEEAQGTPAQALAYYHHALAIYAYALGPEHPTTRACCGLRRLCLAAAQLGPLPIADTQEERISQVIVQARAAIDAALADPAADRYILATAIEARARWAEEGPSEAYRALAAELRALIPQLGVTPDDPDAL